ncbi:glyoxylase-like metal-dependent hydrolase (beta-lactamase superfamily II) [Brevibacterium sanguinis]|uniref:Glyoxylase-like metal-dependent hydrolase (Beta-lactamase superfamily II) n=2 Tax=Brevibacterium TaxID=1696 RepID=A0A366IES0_9MICO|nr:MULTISPECIES: MBL fold metallo-hydrolase [Brevibacterium]RBP63405.1 glyoxylase-like metal-dependent hydrolase (beta-lactamase superfamily II) [Brevibacterium sanguinis]RBP69872.1 glyoxylase-like metal-dependent hydrolase (beta-lactamase superfamily II) [Brevibacterium celere]
MRIRANNPSPMTLTGTNTYVLVARDDRSALLIDPGPELAAHRDAILAEVGERRLAAIVLTHQHADHSEMLGSVDQWAPDVPVHAVLPEFSRHARPVRDGDTIAFGGDEADVVRIVATPGHTMDSISVLHDGVLYSGDTVLGEGTTIVTHPQGSLEHYLDSLDRLTALLEAGEYSRIEPAHGPTIDHPAEVLDHYRRHRRERIAQVRAALDQGARTAAEVCDIVYHDIDPSVRGAAEQIVRAQLSYLGALRPDDHA